MLNLNQNIALNQMIRLQEIGNVRREIGEPIRENSPTWAWTKVLIVKLEHEGLTDDEQDELNIAMDTLARGGE